MTMVEKKLCVKSFLKCQPTENGVTNIRQLSLNPRLSESLRSTPGISGVSLAVFQALWAYDGFDSITCITDEVKNPRRTLPLIIITSVIAVMSLYLIVNLAYFGGWY